MTVRNLPLGVAISVAVHVVAVAWLATTGEARVLPAPHPAPVTVEIVAPEPEPLAIALLDEPVVRAPEPPTSPARAEPRAPARTAIRATPSTTASAASATGDAEAAPPGEPAAPGPRSRYLTMRGPAIERGLSQGWLDDFAARSKPLAPEVEPSGELAPAGGGRYRSNQGPFRVDVDKDGKAHITDEPNVHVRIAVPTARGMGKAVSRWAEDPYADPDAAKRQVAAGHKVLGEDDRSDSSNIVPVPVLAGGFDITDGLMRSHGQDPYASKKLRVLDATRDERAAIGARYRRDQLVHASQLMKAATDRLWSSSLDVAAKKRELFALWDDCAEAGAPELVEASQRARGFLVGFVNAKLPAGSPDAFSPDELARLNARRVSRTVFAPYGAP